MGTFKMLKDNLPKSTGHAALYELDPPLEGHRFVRVSAVNAPFSGPETYIFGCDENGDVSEWGELPGSFRGGLSHEEALTGAGYEPA